MWVLLPLNQRVESLSPDSTQPLLFRGLYKKADAGLLLQRFPQKWSAVQPGHALLKATPGEPEVGPRLGSPGLGLGLSFCPTQFTPLQLEVKAEGQLHF